MGVESGFCRARVGDDPFVRGPRRVRAGRGGSGCVRNSGSAGGSSACREHADRRAGECRQNEPGTSVAPARPRRDVRPGRDRHGNPGAPSPGTRSGSPLLRAGRRSRGRRSAGLARVRADEDDLAGKTRARQRSRRLGLLNEARRLLERVIRLDAPPTRHAWAWRDLARTRNWLRLPLREVEDAYARARDLLPNEPRFARELADIRKSRQHSRRLGRGAAASRRASRR